jgi:hypothetical protein
MILRDLWFRFIINTFVSYALFKIRKVESYLLLIKMTKQDKFFDLWNLSILYCGGKTENILFG